MPVGGNQGRGHGETTPRRRGASQAATVPLSDSDLEAAIGRFYAAVLADDVLAPYFAGASMDRLKRMQLELFGAALGDGPMSGASRLQDAHARLHLEARHVSRFFEHLVDTLDDMDVDADIIERLLGRLAIYVDDVVGSHGEAG
jgi:hemoglobin